MSQEMGQTAEGGQEQVSEGDAEARAAVEAEARQFGWKPLDEFHGAEEHWQDAPEFLENGRAVRRVQSQRIQEQAARLQQQETQIRELLAAQQQFKTFLDSSVQAARESAVRELRAQLRQARAEGDDELVEQLEDKLDEARAAPVPSAPQQPQPPADDPAARQTFDSWRQAVGWYDADPKLRLLADQLAVALRAELNAGGQQLPHAAFLQEVERRVRDIVPEKFTRKAKAGPDSGAGGGAGGGGSPIRLTAEQKAAAAQLIAMGVLANEAEYLKYSKGSNYVNR